ncbi:MAG: efflux RND transporter periplasmic adaptor subunit, partial [Planctomycetota bacterium]
GQRVVTQVQSMPGREFVGRVAFVDPMVNRETRTIGVRVVIPNEDGALKIGDYASAAISAAVNAPESEGSAVYDPDLVGKWISPRHPQVIRDGPGQCPECGMELVPASTLGFVSTPLEQAHDIVVPRDAVLMAGEQSVAYVETEPGRFEFRNVVVGQIVGDKVSIVKGVDAGERVVSGAALLVDSQFSMAGKPSLIDPTRAIEREPEETDLFNSPEIMAALEALSDEDKGEVMAQKICPVTMAALGSMGTPLPVDVRGRRVWICCAGCETGLRNEPETYFAILDEAAAEEADKQKIIDEAMAALDAENRVLAVAQKICPVANFPLGSMGTPIRVDVEGRAVFICCEGCRQSLIDEPQKYLEILDNGIVEAPGAEAAVPVISTLPQIRPLDEPDSLPRMSLPQTAPPHEAGEGSGSDNDEEPANVTDALSKLSAVEQRLARAQRTCPVADMQLGSMGTPPKVDVNGRTVFICCEGCRGALLANPDKYLAKLNPEAGQ